MKKFDYCCIVYSIALLIFGFNDDVPKQTHAARTIEPGATRTVQGCVTSGLADRFLWHPDAGIAPTGRDQTSAAALVAAFARTTQGLSFRIGGGSEPPLSGPQPMFETLTSGTSAAPRRIWRSQASWTASFAINAALFGIAQGTKLAAQL